MQNQEMVGKEMDRYIGGKIFKDLRCGKFVW